MPEAQVAPEEVKPGELSGATQTTPPQDQQEVRLAQLESALTAATEQLANQQEEITRWQKLALDAADKQGQVSAGLASAREKEVPPTPIPHRLGPVFPFSTTTFLFNNAVVPVGHSISTGMGPYTGAMIRDLIRRNLRVDWRKDVQQNDPDYCAISYKNPLSGQFVQIRDDDVIWILHTYGPDEFIGHACTPEQREPVRQPLRFSEPSEFAGAYGIAGAISVDTSGMPQAVLGRPEELGPEQNFVHAFGRGGVPIPTAFDYQTAQRVSNEGLAGLDPQRHP